MFLKKCAMRKLTAAAFIGLAAMVGPSAAQSLAGKPVTIVVPFSPGGGTDILARTVSQPLGERLNTTIVVDNKPGASGAIAAQFTARADPDGHTLMVGSTSEIGINPSLYSNLQYDVNKDFKPVAALASTPMVLVVDPSSPIKTAKDLVDMAKAKPGEVAFASAGVGSGAHLAAELFFKATDIKLTHIPYKGVGQALTDVIGAQKGMVLFTTLPSSRSLASSGKLRVVAVSSKERSALMPDVPTFIEAGIPEYVMEYWYGLVAPAGTPDTIVNLIHKEADGVLQEPSIKEALGKQGLTPNYMTTAEFAQFIKDDMARWADVVDSANLKQTQ